MRIEEKYLLVATSRSHGITSRRFKTFSDALGWRLAGGALYFLTLVTTILTFP